MTQEHDNPLERILDELLVESRRGETSPPDPDSARAGKPPGDDSPAGSTSRAYRFLADDAVLREILHDMAKLSDGDLAALDSARLGSGEFKGLDQVARETGLISFDQQEAVFRVYLERRVDELKEKLLGAQIGSYSLIDELGRGGMGIVFRARQESPMFTREVALKFMLAGSETEAHDRERFVSEVKGLAGLSHPFLVPLFDSGIEGDLYYFSMEFIDGQPLSDASIVEGLSVEKKVEIVRDIARALGYLHAQGVIHRDVKPGNIMLDRHGNARLLDFGIAQFSADPRRRVAQAGTPFYMAPEVIDPRGPFGPIGPGTDIYALGAVLYKLLTGQEVFPCEADVTEVFRKTLAEEPSFASTRRRLVHPDLERVVRRCLRKRVDERYASAGELADGLDRFLRRTRFKTSHLVGAGLLVVLALVVVFYSLRDPPATPTAAELAASAALGAEKAVEAAKQKVRELKTLPGLEALNLEADDENWLEQRLEALEALALEAGTDHGANEFDTAFHLFHSDGARRLQEKARMKLRPLRTARFLDDTAYDGLAGFFQEAKEEGTSPTALKKLLVAIDRIEEATRQEKEKREIDQERRDAEAARQSARDARRHLEGRNLRAVSEKARELFEEGGGLDGTANRHLANREYKKARNDFEDAKEQYERARTAYNEGLNLLEETKSRLRSEIQVFAAGLNERYESYWINVPEELRTRLTEVKRASESPWTEISNAQSVADLAPLRKQFDGWRDVLARAEEQFQSIKDAAERGYTIVEEASTRRSPRLRRLPVELSELARRADENRSSASRAIEAGEFLTARQTCRSFARVCRELDSRFDELTRGMHWIDGARPDTGFWIDRNRVSVKEYEAYLNANRSAPKPVNWKQQLKSPDAPVVGVSFTMARAFAAFHGKSLPNEAQWDLARQRVPELSNGDPEWLRPAADGKDALIASRTATTPARITLESTREARTGFRCVLEALSWRGRDVR